MVSLRRIGLAVGVLVVVVLVFVGYAAWRVHQVQQELTSAETDAAQLQTALSTGDQAGVDHAVADLQVHSAAASSRTGGFTWSVLGQVPVFGDDARGIRTLSQVLTSLSGSGLQPLLKASTQLNSVVPRNGRIPVAQLQALRQPVAQGAATLAAADATLSQQDASGYITTLRRKYTTVADEVHSAATALRTADKALGVMPDLLGAQGPRNYLLVVQNNAEIRSSGGLLGSVSELHVDDGRISLTRQAAGNTLTTASPVLPLTSAERQIYGPTLGDFFIDANFTPDFPRAASLMEAHWDQQFGGTVDGVLSLDPVALSYILAATGPVQVGDLQLTSVNVVDELLHDVYLRYRSPARQDVFFEQAARAVFTQVTSGVGAPREVLRALARATDEHRIYISSTDPQDAEKLAGTEIAGGLVTDPHAAPQVGVYVNDATGAKMSYYLRYEVAVDATSCADFSQTLAGTMVLRSQAPLDAASTLPRYVTGGGQYGTPPGDQIVSVRLYGPVGGTIGNISAGGRKAEGVTMSSQDDRPVATVPVALSPQESAGLQWTMTTGAGQTQDTQVSVTPGIAPIDTSMTAPTACS